MLSRDVVSSPSDPRYRQPMSLDTEARLNVISAAHLYTMPDFHLRLTFTIAPANVGHAVCARVTRNLSMQRLSTMVSP